MGQAKRRGTLDERIAQSQIARAELLERNRLEWQALPEAEKERLRNLAERRAKRKRTYAAIAALLSSPGWL